MAFYDRCNICDYTVHSGSGIIGVSSGGHGRVRRYGDEFLCDTCISVISETLGELYIGDASEVETKEDTSALPVRQEQ